MCGFLYLLSPHLRHELLSVCFPCSLSGERHASISVGAAPVAVAFVSDRTTHQVAVALADCSVVVRERTS